MEYNDEIDLSKRKFTSRLIVERALVRGWKIIGFKTNPAVLLLFVPGRSKPIKIFSASPPQMSYPASKIAKDKFITNQILAMNGIPVPKELLISHNDENAIHESERFLSDNHRIVVKPLDASHGKGISVNVTSNHDLVLALKEASTASAKSSILLQEQIYGVDVRVVCIGYEFVDAISRIPASVVGDGVHTIRELIEITNSSEERGHNYATKLNIIPADKAEAYLGKNEMDSIPPAHEEIQVIGVSNVGMGGVRYNIKNDIPDFLKEISIRCAKELELPVCGVDFMVKRLPKNGDTLEDLCPHVIEVNECPSLTMHDDIHSPEQNAEIDKYLDYVASASSF